MTEKRFKNCLIEFDKARRNLEKEKRNFVFEISKFMKNKGIPVRVLFFGDTFGLDIEVNMSNFGKTPLKIPLNVLMDLCKEFGCDFEYTTCDGHRWIFSFDGMSMEFNF